MSNIAISRDSTLSSVMGALDHHADQVQNMLPVDLPMDRFRANIENALRSNPDLLDCTTQSLVESCMKAAYDGLRIDGREAALVIHKTNNVLLAQYYPMAFGLVQQVLRGGQVLSMFAEVIREGDHYRVRRGTDPGIDHEPALEGDGKILAAYSVAKLASGVTTFEFLTGADIVLIRAAAKTKMVWDKWPGEMSKKSAIRRHRKTLPLGERDIVIRDGEGDDLYPAFQAPAAPSATRLQERPTRKSIAQERAASVDGESNGDGGQQQADDARDETARAAAAKPAKTAAKNDAPSDPERDLPEDDAAWHEWASAVEKMVINAPTAAAINQIAREEDFRMTNAPKDRANYLRGLITDTLADIATDQGAS